MIYLLPQGSPPHQYLEEIVVTYPLPNESLQPFTADQPALVSPVSGNESLQPFTADQPDLVAPVSGTDTLQPFITDSV